MAVTIRAGDRPCISSVTLFELWTGILHGRGRPRERRELDDLVTKLPVLSLDDNDARRSAEVRSALERRGTPIGPYDMLIAGQALARGLTLVTGNIREFERVDGLRLENWLA